MRDAGGSRASASPTDWTPALLERGPLSISQALGALSFVGDRTPASTAEQLAGAFAELTAYRDGAVFIGHWAGKSEWERHGAGDELVLVLEGRARLILRVGGDDIRHELGPMELLVVPSGTWHRFEVEQRVQVLTVTPHPTEHAVELPV